MYLVFNASCFKAKTVRAVIYRLFYIVIEKCYTAFKLVYYLNASACNLKIYMYIFLSPCTVDIIYSSCI
jgi:hypothetical protein